MIFYYHHLSWCIYTILILLVCGLILYMKNIKLKSSQYSHSLLECSYRMINMSFKCCFVTASYSTDLRININYFIIINHFISQIISMSIFSMNTRLNVIFVSMKCDRQTDNIYILIARMS